MLKVIIYELWSYDILLVLTIIETKLEKETIKDYAHKTHQSTQEVKYEAEFEVPESFGEVGAVLVENEHHKEMFVKDIVLEGFILGPVTFSCNSWVHSKHDNPVKRVFFSNKVSSSFTSFVIYILIIYGCLKLQIRYNLMWFSCTPINVFISVIFQLEL